MEAIVAVGLLLVYLAIGFVFGFIAILQIIWSTRQNGLDATSQKVLGLKYGCENGSTSLSLFVFPLFFCIIFWPLTLCGFDSSSQI